MFSWRCSIHEMGPFGGLLGPSYPKYGSSLLKFRPAVVSHKKKTVSEHSFKINCLSGNRTYPKLTNLPLENPKYCQKTKISQKLHLYECKITQVLSPR